MHKLVQKLGRPQVKLRAAWYRMLGVKIGANVHVGGKIHMAEPKAISIGNNVNLRGENWFSYTGPNPHEPHIVIGDNVFIGQQCEFNVNEHIVIGSNCLIGSGCKFIDGNHGIARDALIRTQPGKTAPIQVGEDVWLGSNVTVLQAVTIGRGAVVAAGAVVNKSIPEYEIWGGVPARKLRDRV